MKKSLNLFVILVALFATWGCHKMDENYKGYLIPGGRIYPEKVLMPVLYTGRNRVKITWLRGSDPSVTRARIFWDNHTDSTDVTIPANQDTIRAVIDNLAEKSYTFEIITYDKDGHASVPVELLGEVYGDTYQAGLLATPIDQSILSPGRDSLTIQWGNANISGGAYATEVKYLDVDGTEQIRRFLLSETTSVVTGINCDSNFSFRTVYLPDSLTVDTFYTDFIRSPPSQYDKSTWKVIDFSSERSPANDLAADVIDGSLTNRWVSASDSQYPHFVTVDMERQLTITSFEVFRMTGNDQMCDTFQLFISNDNATWTDLGVYSFNRQSDDGQFYDIAAHPKARYFKFVGLSGPKNFILVGEISVYGL